MGLNIQELYGSTTRPNREGMYVTKQRTVEFSTNTGAVLLPVGAPVAFDATAKTWVNWDQDDTATADHDIMRGFVAYFPIQLDASDEVLGVIMEEGEIHFDDVDTSVSAGSPTAQQIKDHLTGVAATQTTTLREMNITVTGIPEVH